MATSDVAQADELGEITQHLNAIGAYLRYFVQAPEQVPPDTFWIDAGTFCHPTSKTQQRLQQSIANRGYGSCRKTQATALLLRFGWASGLQIGAWMTHYKVLVGLQQSIAFNHNLALVSAVAVQACDHIAKASDLRHDNLRKQLINELIQNAAPAIEAYHQWSGLSKSALWSMVCSSWASQFTTIGEKLGQPDLALFEANRVLSLHPISSAYRPLLYAVYTHHKIGICQKRHLCCLWFKSSPKSFCSSCPILPTDERLAKNQTWVKEHGLICDDLLRAPPSGLASKQTIGAFV